MMNQNLINGPSTIHTGRRETKAFMVFSLNHCGEKLVMIFSLNHCRENLVIIPEYLDSTFKLQESYA